MRSLKRDHTFDALRGLVMVLMTLDHTRDFFSQTTLNPQLGSVSNFEFLTRLLSHLCAPVFIFLAGFGASYLNLKKTKVELANFLFKRGLLIIFLELTLSQFVWYFRFDYYRPTLGVLWAIGVSLCVLAALVFLRTRILLFLGSVIILFHNRLDVFRASDFGSYYWIWKVLHEPGRVYLNDEYFVRVFYPVLPWIGVILLGYVFAEYYRNLKQFSEKQFIKISFFALSMFFFLRYFDLYGDPTPRAKTGGLFNVINSFLNCQKYPPSLQFLLWTLGVAFLFLAYMKINKIKILETILVTYGRAPLFFYFFHLLLIHIGAVLYHYNRNQEILFDIINFKPSGYGLSIFEVWLMTILILLLSYFPCRWVGQIKSQKSSKILEFF
ncbi:MAG: DUF1624 domain-containing protein [Bdellovibrionaceae bacterium]|nr:DUF1624 domain-containing protein [Pseudobdellovibrionaceae bacterium]